MRYSELQSTLQNLTNKNLQMKAIADVLGISRQNLDYRVKEGKSDITDAEIILLEQHFGVQLADSVTIDFYPDVFGSCGNGAFVLSETKERITVPKKAFFANFSPVKKYSVVTAHGNSMEPLIYDNDKVIVEHYEGGQIVDNKPYIFCYQDEIYIKRLAKNVNQLVIMPENKIYDIIKLTKEEMNDISIIGQIVGLIRDLR